MKLNLKGLKPNRVTVITVICAVVGLILLVFAGGGEDKKAEADDYRSVISYTEKLEARVEKICLAVDGIEKADVLLTLESGSEFVYADNVKDESRDGGRSYTSDYILIENDDGSAPVLACEIYPKIRGVAVVCNGGDKPAVQKKLTELLSAALGISTGKIRISS